MASVQIDGLDLLAKPSRLWTGGSGQVQQPILNHLQHPLLPAHKQQMMAPAARLGLLCLWFSTCSPTSVGRSQTARLRARGHMAWAGTTGILMGQSRWESAGCQLPLTVVCAPAPTCAHVYLASSSCMRLTTSTSAGELGCPKAELDTFCKPLCFAVSLGLAHMVP